MVVALLASLVAGVAVGLGSLGGARDDPAPRLTFGGWRSEDITAGYPGYRYPYLIHGGAVVCLDRPGQVSVTDVTVLDGTLDVSGYALVDYPTKVVDGTTYAFGDAVGTLAGMRVVDRSGAASTVCRAGVAAGYEVLIELKAGAGTTSSSGFRVHYVSGGSRDHLDIKYRGVIMCQRDHVIPDCDQAA